MNMKDQIAGHEVTARENAGHVIFNWNMLSRYGTGQVAGLGLG